MLGAGAAGGLRPQPRAASAARPRHQLRHAPHPGACAEPGLSSRPPARRVPAGELARVAAVGPHGGAEPHLHGGGPALLAPAARAAVRRRVQLPAVGGRAAGEQLQQPDQLRLQHGAQPGQRPPRGEHVRRGRGVRDGGGRGRAAFKQSGSGPGAGVQHQPGVRLGPAPPAALPQAEEARARDGEHSAAAESEGSSVRWPQHQNIYTLYLRNLVHCLVVKSKLAPIDPIFYSFTSRILSV